MIDSFPVFPDLAEIPDDTMIAYGALCDWWDAKDQVAVHESGLPVCPHCSGVLFEMTAREFREKAPRPHFVRPRGGLCSRRRRRFPPNGGRFA